MNLRQKINCAARTPAMRKLLCFFDSLYFPAVFAVLTLLSSLLGLEIVLFSITILICVFTCIFSADSKPIIVPLVMVVYGTSFVHSPQYPYSSDFFNNIGVQLFLVAGGLIIAAAMIFRVVLFSNGRNFLKESRLRLGLLLMTLAFLLNGAAYSGYDIKNLPFGLLMALSFFAFYIYFFVTLNTDNKTGVYVAYILLFAAGIVLLQLFKIYAFDGIFKDNGEVNKDLIIAGWGMSNNIGAALAMFMPSGLYLSIKQKHGWVYYVLSFVIFGGVCLTQSRASALVAAVILLVAAIILSVKKTPLRKFVRIFNLSVVVVAVISAIILREKITDIFSTFFDRGFSDSGRFKIWADGINNFKHSPIFGVGFYEPIAPDWSYDIENWVFPDMYHNIFIQMLASCGIFGLAAYCIHLAQVVFAVNKKPTRESLFYIAVLLIIFGMSQFDNHLFHVFTALVYSLFILLSEREGDGGRLLNLTPLTFKIKRSKVEGGVKVAADPEVNYGGEEISVNAQAATFESRGAAADSQNKHKS